MDELKKGLSHTFAQSGNEIDLDFDAQVLASLMLQTNALISIKTAVQLCSISRQEIDRRVNNGTFPPPMKLSSDEKSIRKAFRICDIAQWLKSPKEYDCNRQGHSDRAYIPE